MEFRILGPLEVRDGDGQGQLLVPRQKKVLAVLLLAANRVVPTHQLIGAVWDDDPPTTAKSQLQNDISTLRRRLAGGNASGRVIVADGPGYRLRLEPGQLDAQVFLAGTARARDLASEGRLAEAAEQVRSALACWRGPALAGLAGRAVEAAASRLDEQRLTAIEQRVDLELRLGRHADLVGELAELVAVHPHRERLVGQLMVALHRSGRQADALRAYQRLRTRLAEDLGLDPGSAVQELHMSVLRNTVALATAASPAAEELVVVPRQLPHAARHFVGRVAELKDMTSLAEQAAATGGQLLICAIHGMGGIGKTATAVHWAHQVAPEFPDGQLYVNLRGFDPSGQPVKPAEAIRGFLDAFGVPAQRIPASLEAQASLYRSLVSGRRVLVVLDNARDADQVRPLLPGSATCLVLVTSRNRLTSLVAAEAAHPVTLDLLTTAEAGELLARHLGAERVASEPAAADELVTRCAQLPLALAIVAARAAAHPAFPLATFAAELTDTHLSPTLPSGRLDALDAGDQTTQVRAALSWSYARLSDDAARLFRLLGLHPGPDIATAAAANLLGVPEHGARPPLAELDRAHLVTERSPGRYGLHDLLRVYAAEQAHAVDPEDERQAAVHRVLDHYLHTADAADHLLTPSRSRITIGPAGAGVTGVPLMDSARALAWFIAERDVLIAAAGWAADTGFDTHAWQLARCLTAFLDRRGHWHELVSIQRTALRAAQRAADGRGQVHAHRGLARAYSRLGGGVDAQTHLWHALDLGGRIGDHAGVAQTLMTLTHVFGREGRDGDALRHAQQARDLFEAIGDRNGHARALNNIGWFHAQLGDYEQALGCCRQALVLLRGLDDLNAEANVWDSLGYTHHHLGQYSEAVESYRRAVTLFGADGDRHAEARTHTRLGDTHRARGDDDAARGSWRQALSIMDELGHPDASRVRATLDALRTAGSVDARTGTTE